jgi:hypothetical protein
MLLLSKLYFFFFFFSLFIFDCELIVISFLLAMTLAFGALSYSRASTPTWLIGCCFYFLFFFFFFFFFSFFHPLFEEIRVLKLSEEEEGKKKKRFIRFRWSRFVWIVHHIYPAGDDIHTRVNNRQSS